MYAVIKTGGKQYKVTTGDVIEVEHLKLKSDTTTLTPVLVFTDEGRTIIGPKELAAYKVGVKLLGDAKGDKVTVFKYRPKSGYASKTGHRQLYSLIEITSIGSGEAPAKAKGKDGSKGKASAEKPPKPSEGKAEGDHQTPGSEGESAPEPAKQASKKSESESPAQPEFTDQADNL